jgi:hypothetical protein
MSDIVLSNPLLSTNEAASASPTMVNRLPGSTDEPFLDNRKDFITAPANPHFQPGSALAMSKIYSIHTVPRRKALSCLAVSKVSVVHQEVPQRPATPSLVVSKETVSNAPTTSLNTGSEPTVSTSTRNVDAEHATLSVEIHDATSSTVEEGSQDYQPSRKIKSSVPSATASKTIKGYSGIASHLVSPEQTLPAQSQGSWRTIDVEELLVNAKKRKASDEACAGESTNIRKRPLKMPKSTSSTKSVLGAADCSSPKAMVSSSAEVRSYSPGPSSAHQSSGVHESSQATTKPLPGDTQACPFIIEDTDNEEIAHESSDEGRDLMEYAFLQEKKRATPENHEQTVLNNRQPSSSHRRSPRHARVSRQQPGFYNWKTPVEGMLEEIEERWQDLQSKWITLYDRPNMVKGPAMKRFQEKMCETVESFLAQRVSTTDVQKLLNLWKITRLVTDAQVSEEEKKELRSFTTDMSEFNKASRVLQGGDSMIGVDLEGDDEDDMDWTPDVG